jgi:hypothetical protein
MLLLPGAFTVPVPLPCLTTVTRTTFPNAAVTLWSLDIVT